eukprot:gb/GEZN01008789.1/.p1 GENE.gb/GEZN01008789.1/~~gb/GEZN01008789.1/.p1  ORF type:complete len:339 (+),score=67.01 gb/GEZN01008789.1/:23-1039(+)
MYRAALALGFLLIICAYASEEGEPASAAFVDEEKVAKHQKRMEWRRAQPKGCKEADPDGSNSWCDIGQDDRLTVKPTFWKRAEQLFNAATDKGLEGAELDAEEVAGAALFLALQDAETKFSQSDKPKKGNKKRGNNKGNKEQSTSQPSEPPRRPSEYRCRKKGTSLADLKYFCAVSDFTFDEQTDTEEDTATTPNETPTQQCEKLERWQQHYQADQSDDKVMFFMWLRKESSLFGELLTLREHMADSKAVEAMSQKAINTIKQKAQRIYKQLSKQLHPDKLRRLLTRACSNKEAKLVNAATAVFERAKALEICINRPLRCELPGLEGEWGFAGVHSEL